MTGQRGLTILPMEQAEAPWAVPAEPAAAAPRPGEPFEGEIACLCGGHRRTILPNTAAHPVWRCLHCGFLSNLRPQLRPRR
jgi:hypothetical protein